MISDRLATFSKEKGKVMTVGRSKEANALLESSENGEGSVSQRSGSGNGVYYDSGLLSTQCSRNLGEEG